ncbi:MAG: efflux RND transporter permease subunit [Acidobacteria bacterium]|nr:efflux RND transporter permease subunit [Acidobacteriota bacterium]
MLERIIDFHLEHRWFVLIGVFGIVALGLFCMLQIPVDAFPDLTNNQVVVIVQCPGMAPADVEQLVTFPIETSLMGIPKTQGIRSISKLDLSIVTIVFDDSVNTYFARQLVNERLQEVRTRMPDGVEPSLGPVATAFGEVYQYTLDGPGVSAMDLKTLQEFQIKNQLRVVPGVNEINTWGGETRQYQIEIDPNRLQAYGLTLRDVYERVRENNANFGGGFIEHSSEQYTVRGIGRARGQRDLEQVVLAARAGTPVMVRDVALVKEGPMPRQGAVLRDAGPETVSGMVIMLKGENGKNVIDRVKTRLASMRLPNGISIRKFYDQSEVIDRTIETVKHNLIEGGVLVVAVLLLFLGNFRAALIVTAIIPLSMLVAFIGMRVFGISANLMSLGAIDFGMIVDGAVVMMENSMRRLQDPRPGAKPVDEIRQAAYEVARPIVFAVAIIIAVYLPIFFLEGLEGRMFRPMAITVCSALIGALIFALTVIPAAASVHFTGAMKEHSEGWVHKLRAFYLRLLSGAIRHRFATVAIALALVVVSVGSLAYIGTEFMPRLDEGSILIETRKLPGISLTESVNISHRVEQVVRQFDEVSGVVTKIGRPDLATEAMGINQGDVYVLLKPYEQWKNGVTKDQLIDRMAAALNRIPGVSYNFTQPMAMRLDEVVSGIKADVALKIFGEDPRVLEQSAEQALHLLSSVPGAADAQMEIVSGVAELRVDIDRGQLARYGLNVSDVRGVIETAIGGRTTGEMIEGQRRFAIVVKLPEQYRGNPDAVRDLLLSAPAGERIRLSQVARVETGRGPEVISREDGQRRIVVQCNVRGRDLGSFVGAAQAKVAAGLRLPPGYSVDWGGQFENQQRAMRRLMIVLPAAILIIFGLLFASFDSVPQALLILLNVPFALVGGIAALWIRHLNLNLSASVGFIALFGVAVLNGIVMVSYINRLRQSGKTCMEAVVEGAGARLRPVLMTALVASLGFIPMALATSAGAEVQRPLATVVIGGLVTSTLLTLLVLPVVYPWFSKDLKRANPAG